MKSVKLRVKKVKRFDKFGNKIGRIQYVLKASGVDRRKNTAIETVTELSEKEEEIFDQILEIFFVFAAVALEVFQHLLDVPYLNMGLFVLGPEDLRRQRELTKPIFFYIIFMFAEICGLLLFWKYLVDFKVRLAYCKKEKIPMDYSFEMVHMVIMSAGELPIMMVLQYFYVEAMTNFSVIAEGFFSNPFVAVNNIVMCFCSFTFLQCCVNMVLDNVFPPGDSLARNNILKTIADDNLKLDQSDESIENDRSDANADELSEISQNGVHNRKIDTSLTQVKIDPPAMIKKQRTLSELEFDRLEGNEFDDLRPDGELTLNELWAILTVFSIYFACVIRAVILANGKTGSSIWARTRYAVKEDFDPINTCFEFNWQTYFSTPDPNDVAYLEWVYLGLCIFSVLRLPYEIFNIFSSAIKNKYPKISLWILDHIQQPLDDFVVLTRRQSKFYDYFLKYPRFTYVLFMILFGLPPIMISIILCGVLTEKQETIALLVSYGLGSLVLICIIVLNYSVEFWEKDIHFGQNLWKYTVKKCEKDGKQEKKKRISQTSQMSQVSKSFETICSNCKNLINETEIIKAAHEICDSAPEKIAPDWIRVNVGFIKIRIAARARPGITWHPTDKKHGLTCNNICCLLFYILTLTGIGLFIFLTVVYGLKLPEIEKIQIIDSFSASIDESCDNCAIDVLNFEQIGCVDWGRINQSNLTVPEGVFYSGIERPTSFEDSIKCLPFFEGEFSVTKFDKICHIQFEHPVEHFMLVNKDSDEGFTPVDWEMVSQNSDKEFTIFTPSIMKSPHAMDISNTVKFSGFYKYEKGFYDNTLSFNKRPIWNCESSADFVYAGRFGYEESDLYLDWESISFSDLFQNFIKNTTAEPETTTPNTISNSTVSNSTISSNSTDPVSRKIIRKTSPINMILKKFGNNFDEDVEIIFPRKIEDLSVFAENEDITSLVTIQESSRVDGEFSVKIRKQDIQAKEAERVFVNWKLKTHLEFKTSEIFVR